MSKIICVTPSTKLKKSVFSVNVTSVVNSPFSPFILKTDKGIVENVYQFSKVFIGDVDENGQIKEEWYERRNKGYKYGRAVRYVMPKGTKELFSYWNGKKLSKVEARKEIYIPLYTQAVFDSKFEDFKKMVEIFTELSQVGQNLYLIDYDGYDRHKKEMSMEDVINCESVSMGHSFVLEKMILDSLGIKEKVYKDKFF